MARHKRSKKQILELITQYGIHIWAVLIIANALLIYSYHYETRAASNNSLPGPVVLSGSPAPSGQVSLSPSVQISPTSGPVGPVINLIFTVPGIGSGGGVMKPLHTKRNVTVFLYAPKINSMDPTVNPLYTVQGTATFDSNPESPTYTSFINPNFDLGSSVQNGNYQIAFRTDLSFTTLIKQTPTDIGGETFSLNVGNQTPLPSQQMLMGDGIPSGNNYSFTINDYNAFINCFGDKNTTTTFCKGQNYADFNDDGIVDGIDYNILLRSLDGLLAEGQILPKITPTLALPKPTTRPKHFPIPTKIIKKTNTASASPAATVTSSKNSGSGAAGGIIFLFFILIILGGGVFLYFKNEKIHGIVNALIHLSPTGSPAENEATETDTSTEQAAEPEAPAENPEAAQSETPIENPTEAQPETPQETQTQTPAPSGDTIEKDCYVKKKGPDEAGTGQWLLLTDDNGAVDAHYAKNDTADGFAKVKGVMKTAGDGKKYMEITELTPEG